MTHRNVGILIWAALIILLLIGLLFPLSLIGYPRS